MVQFSVGTGSSSASTVAVPTDPVPDGGNVVVNGCVMGDDPVYVCVSVVYTVVENAVELGLAVDEEPDEYEVLMDKVLVVRTLLYSIPPTYPAEPPINEDGPVLK